MSQAYNSFKKEVEFIKRLGREWNLDNDEIDGVLSDAVNCLENERTQKRSSTNCWKSLLTWRCIILIISVVAALSSALIYRKTLQNVVERNVQEMIYPGMKVFRKIMLPLIKAFPSLTAWYDETCLVGNPYFQVSDMDCWPCSSTRSVLNLTGSDLISEEYHSGIPFIFKEGHMRTVKLKDLKEVYANHKGTFDEHASRVDSSNGVDRWSTANQLFSDSSPDINPTEKRNSNIKWRLNRLEPIRLVRSLFGSPKNNPQYTAGTAPEKYILIDEPLGPPYPLPQTEGTTVFVVQGSGSRLLVLDPAPECSNQCQRVSVLLQPQHILWYNWWYWRGSSFPVLGNNEMSITYVGSYF
ncbi:hypothetical protein LSTR_LSTR013836 [Laodelphax striatellus]|uniref:Uncharacterized protein n=1 Tax=Laodelphax striatellus TaxID=195883 RepID=A0A482XRZ3_LAOST|nr:hypothetical protein LSTR_LSTR013836 [Laodelphax striatellus]